MINLYNSTLADFGDMPDIINFYLVLLFFCTWNVRLRTKQRLFKIPRSIIINVKSMFWILQQPLIIYLYANNNNSNNKVWKFGLLHRETARHAPWRCGVLPFVRDAHSPAREWASFISVENVFFFFKDSGKNRKLKKKIPKIYYLFIAVFFKF